MVLFLKRPGIPPISTPFPPAQDITTANWIMSKFLVRSPALWSSHMWRLWETCLHVTVGPCFLPTGQPLPALVTPKRLQTSTGGRLVALVSGPAECWSQQWSRNMSQMLLIINFAFTFSSFQILKGRAKGKASREAPDAVRRLLRRTGRSGFAWSYALEASVWGFVWLHWGFLGPCLKFYIVFACFSLSRLASAVYQHRCSCLDRRTIRVSSRDIFCDTWGCLNAGHRGHWFAVARSFLNLQLPATVGADRVLLMVRPWCCSSFTIYNALVSKQLSQ